MKIACIIHSLDGGGAERVIASLASRLADRDHRVTLITLDDGARRRHEVSDGVTLQPLDVMGESRTWIEGLRNTRRRVRRLAQAIAGADPDVVLSFCDRTNILAGLACRSLSVPLVVAERSDPSQQRLGTVWEYLRGRAYRRAAAIIALTETAADHLRGRFDVPVHVIASAVDRPPHLSDRAAAGGAKRILGVGRLEIEKGFDRLIDAMGTIATRHPDWSLRILGEGSMRRELKQQAERLGLSDRVTLPGWISPVWDELGTATIFALPSRYEGFPSALLEAMAMGVPCVAVDCESGPRAVIDDSNQGLLVPNDTQSLADGLEALISDPSMREELGAAAKSVLERFSWDAMVEAYVQVMTNVQ